MVVIRDCHIKRLEQRLAWLDKKTALDKYAGSDFIDILKTEREAIEYALLILSEAKRMQEVKNGKV